MLNDKNCNLCPRECGVDRSKKLGFCGCSDKIKIARAALHYWEEPCISGVNGSGTVFFSGCTLRCFYCQNYAVSHDNIGAEVTVKRLGEIFLELQEKGAHNINLVTPTQYICGILKALDGVKSNLKIPVAYNCGGYEKTETIHELKGYVDIYIPDFKYFDDQIAIRYSRAVNYRNTATEAIKEMISQVGQPVFDNKGMLKKGVIIRHLVLPTCKDDSIAVLRHIKQELPQGEYLLSLMSQYTPFGDILNFKDLNRRITSYEYNAVFAEAQRLGLINGYMQSRSSAKEEYTPPFDLEGVYINKIK